MSSIDDDMMITIIIVIILIIIILITVIIIFLLIEYVAKMNLCVFQQTWKVGNSTSVYTINTDNMKRTLKTCRIIGNK